MPRPMQGEVPATRKEPMEIGSRRCGSNVGLRWSVKSVSLRPTDCRTLQALDHLDSGPGNLQVGHRIVSKRNEESKDRTL